jgi:hypothetical protein
MQKIYYNPEHSRPKKLYNVCHPEVHASREVQLMIKPLIPKLKTSYNIILYWEGNQRMVFIGTKEKA